MELIKTLNHPTIPQLTVQLFADWEQEHPKHHFEFKDDVSKVLQEIHDGNMAGWCVIKIEVSYDDVAAYDCIGGCSYASFEEFIEASDYYSDMVASASRELLPKLQNIFGGIEAVIAALEKTYAEV